ncbi:MULTISPECIES: methyltransferase domain-containing protein [Actinoalloteichus]|uniref:methyltransferase domain-containing protein n=1 Tax=Actinoalloteichus TaxID=65496 RepID=UPI000B28987B|nr:methyltransferase domain-containing protein [Actinoalloteichus caeruleus]
MTPTTHHSAPLRRQLTDKLSADGFLRGSRWEEAFLAVPREAFVSRFVLHDPSGERAEHDLATDGAALEAIYTNASLITRHDAGGTPTSSSTSPSLMALMLERLDAHPGHRVLEIGTGTGYNCALLTHVLGDDAVTTIDLEADLVTTARSALDRLGYHPRLVVGDGGNGVPEQAPTTG